MIERKRGVEYSQDYLISMVYGNYLTLSKAYGKYKIVDGRIAVVIPNALIEEVSVPGYLDSISGIDRLDGTVEIYYSKGDIAYRFMLGKEPDTGDIRFIKGKTIVFDKDPIDDRPRRASKKYPRKSLLILNKKSNKIPEMNTVNDLLFKTERAILKHRSDEIKARRKELNPTLADRLSFLKPDKSQHAQDTPKAKESEK